MAANGGGTNWAGGSYDPETHVAYIPSQRITSSLGLVPPAPNQSDMAYITGSAAPRTAGAGGGGGGEGAGPGLTVQGLPLAKPPYATISPTHLANGETLFHPATPETPDNLTTHPAPTP